jgi:tetratricopeptide (TPR) repeat protein
MTDCLLRINALYHELPRVRIGEWPELQDLLCGYHQFAAHLLRDHQRYDDAIDHLDKALHLAESLNKDELKALVLHRRGRTLENAGRIDEAVNDYQKARKNARDKIEIKLSLLDLAGGCK